MANDGTIEIMVVYAEPGRMWERKVCLPAGATITAALEASAFSDEFPQIDPVTAGVGIFGVRKSLQSPLADGDRIEVYRPLVFDPMVSRHRRAAHRKAGRK